jgi:hypothetical protein
MDNTKPWYASQTVWASILQMGVGAGISLGWFSSDAGTAIATEGPGLLVGLATVVLGVWSLYGRVKATKQVG